MLGIAPKGETIIYEDKKYTPDMVMGEKNERVLRLLIQLIQDLSMLIVEAATGADLFICEGMYGEILIKKQKLENISI